MTGKSARLYGKAEREFLDLRHISDPLNPAPLLIPKFAQGHEGKLRRTSEPVR
jgi:hypothetical protein